MKNNFVFLTIFLSLSSLYSLDFKVKYAFGQAYVRNGENAKTAIKYNSLVKEGQTITTEKKSFVSLVGDDGSVIKLSPNTTLKVKQSANEATKRNMSFILDKGKIFSKIKRLKKENKVYFQTPNAIAAVRGTTLFVTVHPPSTKSDSSVTDVHVTEGKVEVSTPAMADVFKKLYAGEKATLDASIKSLRSLSKNTTKMSAGDLQIAIQGVPLEIDLDKAANNELKNLRVKAEQQSKSINRFIDKAKQQSEDQRDFDIETQRLIGNYRVEQIFQRTAKSVYIRNLTAKVGGGKVENYSLLATRANFKNGVPNFSDIVSGKVNTRPDAILVDQRSVNNLSSGTRSERRMVYENGNKDQKIYLYKKDGSVAHALQFDVTEVKQREDDKTFQDSLNVNKFERYYVMGVYGAGGEHLQMKIKIDLRDKNGNVIDDKGLQTGSIITKLFQQPVLGTTIDYSVVTGPSGTDFDAANDFPATFNLYLTPEIFVGLFVYN